MMQHAHAKIASARCLMDARLESLQIKHTTPLQIQSRSPKDAKKRDVTQASVVIHCLRHLLPDILQAIVDDAVGLSTFTVMQP
eukprot:2242277-Amphidinium_carterae.1